MRGAGLACALALVACQASAMPGTPCTRASDCPSPLACSFGACHAQCRSSRDCPIGARCVAVALGGVCTLDSENHCDTHVCPSPLVCVADECRTSCANGPDCIGGTCTALTCVEPTSTGRDAGAVDASNDAPMIDGGASCGLAMSTAPTRIAVAAPGRTLGDHIAIATGETRGATPVGYVHVGGIGFLDPTGAFTVPTAFLVSARQGDYAHARTTDLRVDSFAVYDARSIALRRNATTGEIQVMTLFVDSTDTIGMGGYRGVVGHMLPDASPYPMDGGHIVRYDSVICSEPGCPRMSSRPIATLGRALVIGDGSVTNPMRYVFRWRSATVPLTLTTSELSAGAPEFSTTRNVPSASFAEISGGSGTILAFRDDAGNAMTWDGSSNAAPVALAYRTTGTPLNGGRLALADVPSTIHAGSTFSHVLAYADASGTAYFDRLYCEPSCTVLDTLSSTMGVPGDVLVSVAAADHQTVGVALASNRGSDAGMAGSVSIAVRDTTGARVASILTVFEGRLGGRIVDLQLATVHDGDRTYFVAAMLVGASGATSGDEIWLASAWLPTSCL